jgi:hypothetical protein
MVVLLRHVQWLQCYCWTEYTTLPARDSLIVGYPWVHDECKGVKRIDHPSTAFFKSAGKVEDTMALFMSPVSEGARML